VPRQDTFPDIATSPLGCTWQRYVDQLTQEHGGWTALTNLLIRRAGPSVGLPIDPATIERGLRRLRARGNAPGGQYGRWLLRYFGVPRPLEDTARWMGQYHSRFADLPLSLRGAQLWLWDRPPIAESPAACWIHLGLASLALRQRDLDGVRLRLAQLDGTTPPAARLEAVLLEARLDHGRAAELLARADASIERLPTGAERDCYHARCADQRAYQLIHTGPAPKLARAARLYRSINANSAAAFARFRRDHGLAYCHWKLGDHERAVRHARAAIEQAGDAGLLRFRVMALELLAHIEPGEAPALRRRAARIVAELDQS
jgi:tetratricopeptide (TPR) repeat protein